MFTTSVSPTSKGRSPQSRRAYKRRVDPAKEQKRQEQQTFTPITWPDSLTRRKSPRCTIKMDSSAITRVPLFSQLPFDIRHRIYSIFLHDAGVRQHILCPSVARRRMPSALHPQFLVSRKCDETSFEQMEACGHYDCQFEREKRKKTAKSAKGANFALADLNSLMRTCKFGYEDRNPCRVPELIHPTATKRSRCFCTSRPP